jgi:14-3-3 protein epsilon
MKHVAKFNQELSNDERNLLSVAYKNSVKTRRDAWRTIQAIQNKEELKGNKFLPLITHYKDKIEDELKGICNDVLLLLDTHLISNSHNPEAIVFF